MNKGEQNHTESRTLGCDGIFTGCSGAIAGFVAAPLLTLWWFMSTWDDKAPDSEIGPLTIPILMLFAAIFGAPIGALSGRIIGAIIKHKMQKRRQAKR
jgi:hypothetical protein